MVLIFHCLGHSTTPGNRPRHYLVLSSRAGNNDQACLRKNREGTSEAWIVNQFCALQAALDMGREHYSRNYRHNRHLALIVPGIILAVMFSLAFPVLIIENTGVGESMGRSRILVSHRWGKTFVAYLILELIVLVASAIVGLVSAPLGFLSPVVSGVLSAFYAPLFAILLTVHYYSNLARLTPPAMDSIAAGLAPTVQPGMKYCVSCGSMMASTAIFCPKCGTTQPA